MSKSKTTEEIIQLGTDLDNLCDEDFFEVLNVLAERNGFCLKENDDDDISEFTKWLSEALHEIRNMK